MEKLGLDDRIVLERRRSYATKQLPCIGRSISARTTNHVPVILKYEDLKIVDQIGQGAFGKVYKVQHKDFSQELVLKGVLSSEKDNDSEEALLREVSLLQLLRHPNLLNSIGVITHNYQLWLVTEYMAVGTLHAYIIEQPHRYISWSSRISMARDIASALAYLHKQGIVHRDLTTHNCLVRSDETIVVADLGLALLKRRRSSINKVDTDNRFRTASCDRPSSEGLAINRGSSCESDPGSDSMPSDIVLPQESRRRNKRRHAIVGSTFWMAPEMFARQPYNEAVDVYSFGIIICQLIGRIDADPDVIERRMSTLTVDMDRFVVSHAPKDTPQSFIELAFVCTKVSSDERPTSEMCHSWLQMLCSQSLSETL